MSANTGFTYTLCDTTATASEAVEVLRHYRYLALDCEGIDLGTVGGKLSVIAMAGLSDATRVATDVSIHVFLFDVLTLEPTLLEPAFALLRSPHVTKVVFDGRMDFSELFHRHGVELIQVLDLQLADVESRRIRGESLEKQLDRLSSYCQRREVQSQPRSYHYVHRLNGLAFCASEHGVGGDREKCEYNSKH